MTGRPLRLLLVDDNPGDVRLAREALREAGHLADLQAVRDGEEALSYLRRLNGHAGAARPDVILLDLNMPRLDGRETLRRLKADEDLRAIPVIVFSSSRSAEDVAACYGLHANCYVTKPADFEGFERVLQAIESFWSQVVELPPAGREPSGPAGPTGREP